MFYDFYPVLKLKVLELGAGGGGGGVSRSISLFHALYMYCTY
jgi:hypothetical protein